jgi:hypothetical protein
MDLPFVVSLKHRPADLDRDPEEVERNANAEKDLESSLLAADPDSNWVSHRNVEKPIVESEPRTWRCEHCGYFMLSMDHHGRALPLEKDAFGKPIPTFCPRCEEDHCEWSAVAPRTQFGDWPNIPSGFASTKPHGILAPRSVTLASSFRRNVVSPSGPASANMPPPHAASPAHGLGVGVSPSNRYKGPSAFYCKRCQRRLMRLDSFGQVVPLETDAYGNIVPLYCPGCRVDHSEWVQGPMHGGPVPGLAGASVSSSTPTAAGARGSRLM